LKISIRRPDDFHVHLRDGDIPSLVGPYTSDSFSRALVMPNTSSPILSAMDAETYRKKLREDVPLLEPLMTIQLTSSTSPEMILEAQKVGVMAAKFYPLGVTTNSGNGSLQITDLRSQLSMMEEIGMILCLHGETPNVFCMDRERDFLQRSLMPLSKGFPKLKIVLEHLSTADAVGYVENLPDNVAATITAHHLVLTLDDVLGDKLKTHHFCKPIAKHPRDREELRRAATSGNPKFFLGTDSAPHPINGKECAEGCAGVFTAPVAMEILAEEFEKADALQKLEAFTSEFGARFYGLPLNKEKLVLEKKLRRVPGMVQRNFVPFMSGKELLWSRSS